ncbi:hypothetical protein ABZT03_34930, partial [Streptomyces sp. NPDC005574]
RSYEQVIKLEQERLVYQARLRSRFGRAWRRKAPVESLMPLRLARYGVPLAETSPSGLAAAGIEPALLPPAPRPEVTVGGRGEETASAAQPAAAPGEQRLELAGTPGSERADSAPRQPARAPEPEQSPWFNTPPPQETVYEGGYDPTYDPEQYAQWYDEQQQAEQYGPYGQFEQYDRYREPAGEAEPVRESASEETGTFPIPSGPNRTRQLGEGGGTPPVEPDEESYYQVFRQSIDGSYPTPRVLGDNIEATYGTALSPSALKNLAERFQQRHTAEMEEDHIA